MATSELIDLPGALWRLAHDLRGSSVRFALVGGLAVSARAEPRLTRDAEVAVSVDNDQEAETVIHRMVRLGYHPEADDLRALAAIASPNDWNVAGDAVQLIVDRGYDRGRDLVTALAALRSTVSTDPS